MRRSEKIDRIAHGSMSCYSYNQIILMRTTPMKFESSCRWH